MAENHAWNMQSWRFFSNNQDKGFLTACEWTLWFFLMQRWQSKHRSLTFAHQQLKRCWHWWRNEGVFWGVGLIASKQTQVHFIHAILLYILWLYHVPFFHQTCVLRDCINTVTFDMSGRELILMCGFGSQMLSTERVVECFKSFLFILHSLPLALLLAVPAFSLGWLAPCTHFR